MYSSLTLRIYNEEHSVNVFILYEYEFLIEYSIYIHRTFDINIPTLRSFVFY